MARIDKKFVLSTSQLNSHKFRAMTEGADLADFISNPIMYWLHSTPKGESREEFLPIGFWEDIKKEGDEITAYPNIDDSDPFAETIGKKILHGTLRAASVEVDPIEVDKDKSHWVDGQKLPTVTKWKLGEASIVDRGSNKGAIAKLKHKGHVITLSDQASAEQFFDLLNPTENTMKIKLNEKTSKVLKLAENTELDATDVVDKLIEVIEAKDLEVTTLKKAETDGKITSLVDKAIADRKIVAGEKDKFIKLAHADYETTKSVLDAMKGKPEIQGQLNIGDDNEAEVGELMKLSYDELFMNGKLETLKVLSFEGYAKKFKLKFNKEPNKPAEA